MVWWQMWWWGLSHSSVADALFTFIQWLAIEGKKPWVLTIIWSVLVTCYSRTHSQLGRFTILQYFYKEKMKARKQEKLLSFQRGDSVTTPSCQHRAFPFFLFLWHCHLFLRRLSKFITAGDFLEVDQSSFKAEKSFAIQEGGRSDKVGYHGNPAASISTAAFTAALASIAVYASLLCQHAFLH